MGTLYNKVSKNAIENSRWFTKNTIQNVSSREIFSLAQTPAAIKSKYKSG
jgi:hypothetical protein